MKSAAQTYTRRRSDLRFKIVLGGTAVLHACRCGGRSIFSVVFPSVAALLFRATSQEQN
jgi:hypothetical protein